MIQCFKNKYVKNAKAQKEREGKWEIWRENVNEQKQHV